MTTYNVFYRRQGYPSANIWCTTIKARNAYDAEMMAYSVVDERYTIVDIVAV